MMASYRRFMTDSQILQSAIRVLQTRGWIQHAAYNFNTGGYCMLGALSAATNSNDVPEQFYVPPSLYAVLSPSGTSHGHDVATYNDAPDRNMCEVIDKLCEAACLAEKRGE